MLHVEGSVLNNQITFDVNTSEKCHQVRKLFKGWFDPCVEESSCSKGCKGCQVPDNFKVNSIIIKGKEYTIK